MRTSRLTPLQRHILELLADFAPPWTLTGGAALAGFHLGHRATRDLDLFWRGLDDLSAIADEVERILQADDLDVAHLHSAPAFRRLRVDDGAEVVVIDLVAETVPAIEPAVTLPLGAKTVEVDTPHEILVNKLCALLGRMELRDLGDVRDLLEAGGDLEKALRDAPRKDGGFSPLTLAWALRGMRVHPMAEALGIDRRAAEELDIFRQSLTALLLKYGAPAE